MLHFDRTWNSYDFPIDARKRHCFIPLIERLQSLRPMKLEILRNTSTKFVIVETDDIAWSIAAFLEHCQTPSYI